MSARTRATRDRGGVDLSGAAARAARFRLAFPIDSISKAHTNLIGNLSQRTTPVARITLKLSCEGENGEISSDSIDIWTGAMPIEQIAPRQLQRPLDAGLARWHLELLTVPRADDVGGIPVVG